MTKFKLSKQTLHLFSDSGLSREHADRMQIRDVSSQKMRKVFPSFRLSDDCSAHEIPYFDLQGEKTGCARYRLYDNDELPKYLQVKGQKSKFYFPPFLDWEKIAADPNLTIYITEGERKAAKACVSGFPCIGLGGVWNWCRKNDSESHDGPAQPIKDFQLISWRNRKVKIVFDSDAQFNTNVQQAIKALRNVLVSLGADPYRIDLPHTAGSEKVGFDDYLRIKGKKLFEKLPSFPLLLNKTVSGTELMSRKYSPLKWIIEGLVPTGLTVLSGPPKVGKSFLTLELVLALSSGNNALKHYKVEKQKCLYLALEDTPRRLQERIKTLQSSNIAINELSQFAYQWERVEDGGLTALEDYLDENPDIKAVFIDTFAKMRKAPRGRENLYHQDYEAVGILKRIADTKGVGIILIHHTKKGVTEDFLESVSGSMGITGAADTVIVLRRDRMDDEGVLSITGRDIGEQVIALTFEDGKWIYKGEANAVKATESQQEILEIMRLEGRPLRQKEIADLTGRKTGGLTKTISRLVRDGHLVRDGYLYRLPEQAASPKYSRKSAANK